MKQSAGRLHIDEAVRTHAFLDRLDGADATLQFTNDVFQQHIAFELHTGIDQGFHRHERGGVAGLHVGNADAVDKVAVIQSAPGIDGPAPADRVGVQVAVEQQAAGAAAAAPGADGVEALGFDRLQHRFEAEGGHVFDHEAR